MALKRRQIGSGSIVSRVEALESRQLLSATLVEITIPVTAPVKAVHKVAKPKVTKPKPAAKPAVKTKSSSGEEHATIGYQAFAG
jgi:hypothetical protein